MTPTPPLPRPNTTPHRIEKASELSTYKGQKNMVAAVNRVLQLPDVRDALKIDYAARPNHRPRISGNYELLYVAFMASDKSDVAPFYVAIKDDHALWHLCGFGGPVSYATLQ